MDSMIGFLVLQVFLELTRHEQDGDLVMQQSPDKQACVQKSPVITYYYYCYKLDLLTKRHVTG